eukprot:14738481-Alexandrium_andersonii.AAC.1
MLFCRRGCTLCAVSVRACGRVAQCGCSMWHDAHQLRLQWPSMHAACMPYLDAPALAPQSRAKTCMRACARARLRACARVCVHE